MYDESFHFRYITSISKDIDLLKLTKENINKFKKCMNTNLKLELMYILGNYSDSSISFNDIVSYSIKYNRKEIQNALYSLLKYDFIGRRKRKNNLYYYKIKEIGNKALEFIYINYIKKDKYLEKFIQKRNRKIESSYNWDYDVGFDKEIRISKKYKSNFLSHLIFNIFHKIIYGKTDLQLSFERKQEYIESTPQFNQLRDIRFLKRQVGYPYNLPIEIEFYKELFRLKKISKYELKTNFKRIYTKLKKVSDYQKNEEIRYLLKEYKEFRDTDKPELRKKLKNIIKKYHKFRELFNKLEGNFVFDYKKRLVYINKALGTKHFIQFGLTNALPLLNTIESAKKKYIDEND